MFTYCKQTPAVLYLLCLCLLPPAIQAADTVDSLKKLLSTGKSDTGQVRQLNLIAKAFNVQKKRDSVLVYTTRAIKMSQDLEFLPGEARAQFMQGKAYYYKRDFLTAIASFKKALALFRKTGNAKSRAKTFYQQALAYKNLSNYDQALLANDSAAVLFSRMGDSSNVAAVYNNMGIINYYQGNYAQTVEYFIKSAQIKELLGDRSGMAGAYNNIAEVYRLQKNYPKAIESADLSIEIYTGLDHKKGIAAAYNNKGTIYEDQEEYDKALENHFRSLKIKEEVGYRKGMTDSYNNIGAIYTKQGAYDKALDYQQKALAIQEMLDDKWGMTYSLNGMGDLYAKKGMAQQAITQLKKSIAIGEMIGAKAEMKEAYQILSDIYADKKDFANAYGYYRRYAALKDTLHAEEVKEQFSEMQTKYETAKKEQEIDRLEQQNKIQELRHEDEVQRQKNLFIGGLIFVLLGALFIYSRYRIKKKANAKLEKAYHEIELKNQHITDSINYAKRIQEAILPTDEEISQVFRDYFILFKPRDIVSGDFYWFSTAESNVGGNGAIYIAAADCTGHGVPGAFMSMIGTSLLNEIVNEKKISEPAKILDHLREGIIRSLKQNAEDNDDFPDLIAAPRQMEMPPPKGRLRHIISGTSPSEISVKDGMDIALCKLDLRGLQLEYAGAYNPLYIFRNGSFLETKADRFPIGVHFRKKLQDFTNHTQTLQNGDSIYLFSDGFPDQFGGSQGRKFNYKRFRKLLTDVQGKPMADQGVILEKELEAWKGSMNQIDDILVIGIRV